MSVFQISRLSKPRFDWAVLIIAVSIAAAPFSSAVAQNRHWSQPVNGSWNDGFKWTDNAIPDTILETANINTAGNYEVTYNSNYSIGGLTLGATGASLTMFGIGGQNSSLEIATDTFVSGTINIDSHQAGLDSILICNGTLTNESTGNFSFGGTSTSSSSDRIIRTGLFTNNGNINVNQNGRFDLSGGVLTNNNMVNVAAGKSLGFGANFTLNQNAGTFDNQGTTSMTGGTVNFNGGNFIGNALYLRNSTLNVVGTGSGVFDLSGVTNFSGNVVAGQQLNLNGISGIHQTTTATADFTNFGIINFNSNVDGFDVVMTRAGTIANAMGGTINFGGLSSSTSSDRDLRADSFINDGVVNVNENARFNQTDGVYTNTNTINVAAGKSLSFGSNNTFNQDAGTFDNQGSFSFNADTLNYNGGNFTGNNIALLNSTLNNNTTGTGVFDLTGVISYTGDLVAGQQLNLMGVSGIHQTTTLGADFTNHSTINMDSNVDGFDVVMTRAGSITNSATGTINFGGLSSSSSSDRDLRADSFINDGVVNVNENARFNQTNGVYTNNNVINVAAGKSLSFGSNNTFNQDAGTLDNQGTFSFNGDTLNYNGGNFTGNNIALLNSTLNNNTTGTGVFDLTGVVSYSGDLVAGQQLNLMGVSGIHQTTTLGADFTNHSTINMDSNVDGFDVVMTRAGSVTNSAAGTINFGGLSSSNSSDRDLRADSFINDGVINVNENARFNQTNGVYTNNNTINIATGKSLSFGSNNTFNQDAGTLDNQGTFSFNGDTLNYNGGNFTGNNIAMLNSTLNNNTTGTGVFDLTGVISYSGDLVTGQQLNLMSVSGIHQTTTLGADFTNHSTVNMDSNVDGFDVAMIRAGSITNSAAGTINFGGLSSSSSSDRDLRADSFINDGVVNVNENGRFNQTDGVYTNNNTINIATGKSLSFGSNNTFNQDAGTLDNQGAFSFNGDTLNYNGGNFTGNHVSLHSSALNIGIGSTGFGVFDLTGANTISGDVAENQAVNFLALSGIHQTTVASADFSNAGSIQLNSDIAGFDVALVRDGSISNTVTGTIVFGGSSTSPATDRVLNSELHNAGLVDIAVEDIYAQIGSNSSVNPMNHINTGTILNRGGLLTIQGESFTNESGGTLAGEGTYDFSDTGLANEGIIAAGFSAGHLEFHGQIDLSVTSELQFELGGTALPEFDRLSFLDSLHLDGELSVSFIDSFQDFVQSTDTFTIVDSMSTTGTFFGLADGDRFLTADGYGSFQISYSGNNVVLGNFQAVPEPGVAWLLIGITCAATLRRRRVAE